MTAELSLSHRQPNPFGSKNQRHWVSCEPQLIEHLQRSRIGVEGPCGKFTRHACGGHLEDGAREGLLQRFHHRGRFHQVVSTRGKRNCLGRLRELRLPRGHNHELGQAHCFHRPRNRANVAGVRRLHQNNPDSAQAFLYNHVMHPMINVGIRAARRAGRIITRAAFDIDTVRVARKQANDFVTEVDRAAEDAIIESLLGTFPSHTVLGEESGHVDAQGRAVEGDPRLGEHVWIVDPLDGTTNFIHSLPQYAISIALMERGVITQGVIYDPNRDELFTASRGRGAFLNDRRIRVSKRLRLQESLLGTGFPFRRVDDLEGYLELFARVSRLAAGVRRPGAAALDLAYVACGRYDGFFELGLAPWDCAAGALMVTEAGGLVGDFKGETEWLFGEQVLAGTPKVFAALVAMVADCPKVASLVPSQWTQAVTRKTEPPENAASVVL